MSLFKKVTDFLYKSISCLGGVTSGAIAAISFVSIYSMIVVIILPLQMMLLLSDILHCRFRWNPLLPLCCVGACCGLLTIFLPGLLPLFQLLGLTTSLFLSIHYVVNMSLGSVFLIFEGARIGCEIGMSASFFFPYYFITFLCREYLPGLARDMAETRSDVYCRLVILSLDIFYFHRPQQLNFHQKITRLIQQDEERLSLLSVRESTRLIRSNSPGIMIQMQRNQQKEVPIDKATLRYRIQNLFIPSTEQLCSFRLTEQEMKELIACSQLKNNNYDSLLMAYREIEENKCCFTLDPFFDIKKPVTLEKKITRNRPIESTHLSNLCFFIFDQDALLQHIEYHPRENKVLNPLTKEPFLTTDTFYGGYSFQVVSLVSNIRTILKQQKSVQPGQNDRSSVGFFANNLSLFPKNEDTIVSESKIKNAFPR